MILRTYGETLQSVDIAFDSKSFSEIGFRRNRQTSFPVEAFESEWTRESVHELSATAEGDVQDSTQQRMLDDLQKQLEALGRDAGEDAVIRIESDERDWPKARDEQKNVIVDGQNRFRFLARVEPPLRVAVWRRSS